MAPDVCSLFEPTEVPAVPNDNRFAGTGIGGHHGTRMGKDEWLTPPAILEDLGPFDLDPCAPIERPWPTAAQHFTIEDNGLLQRWFGRVWCNPPYGTQTGRWLARLADHGRGTALIFARTETEAFFQWVWEQATALFFLRGRLNFHHVDGRRASSNSGAPSVLIAYGLRDAERLGDFRAWPGQFVSLRMPPRIAVLVPGADMTWRALVASIMAHQGRATHLDELYVLLARHPKARANQHWQAKVRQVLQAGPFRRLDKGLWQFSGSPSHLSQ